HLARLLAQLGHDPAGRGDGGVRVGVEGPHATDPLLDEMEVAAGSGEVGVAQQAPAIGGLDVGATADLVLADEGRRLLEALHGRRVWGSRGGRGRPMWGGARGAGPRRAGHRRWA